MAQQHINTGTQPDGKDGDTNRVAWWKAESNFNELYESASTLSGAVDGLSGEVDGLADSVANALSFKNKIINGNFNWWQRGTNFAAATGAKYTADRWNNTSNGTTLAVSQQAFALGQGIVPWEPTYFIRNVVTSAANAANYACMLQNIESVRVCAGRTLTLSFWAKADANRNIAVELSQYFGTGGAPSAQVTGIGAATVALTSAWQKKTVTFTVPSVAGKTLGTGGNDYTQVVFWFDAGSNFNGRSNSLGQQSGTFDIAQVQLEQGGAATAFELTPPAVEILQCKRFFHKLITGARNNLPTGFNFTTTQHITIYNFPVTMRTAPSVTFNGSWRILVNAGAVNVNSFSLGDITTDFVGITGNATGLTTGQGGNIQAQDNQGANAYIQFDAEL